MKSFLFWLFIVCSILGLYNLFFNSFILALLFTFSAVIISYALGE